MRVRPSSVHTKIVFGGRTPFTGVPQLSAVVGAQAKAAPPLLLLEVMRDTDQRLGSRDPLRPLLPANAGVSGSQNAADASRHPACPPPPLLVVPVDGGALESLGAAAAVELEPADGEP